MSKHLANELASLPHPNPLPEGEGAIESLREFCVSWDETRHTLGMDEMDNTHREFIAQVAALIAASDAEFPALFQALAEHTHAHFAAEGKLMRDSNYKGLSEHDSEHQRVLGELQLLSRSLKRGQFAPLREYVKEGLPKWFDTHLAMMDSALVMHLKKQP